MSRKMRKFATICAVVGLFIAESGTAQANWEETFGGNAFDQTWTFGCFPDVTKTFSATIMDGPGDDDYLGLDETTAYDPGTGSYGSAFGMGFGSNEDFSDVRVGALVNITGDASPNYFGVAARANWFIDPDGSITGAAPGMVVSGAYILLVHWEDGPTNMRIEILKIFMNSDRIMGTFQPEVPVPGEDHDRSRYIELDVVGSDPVYVTGSIYEYKGGPLLARSPVMVDTSGKDAWESDDPCPPEFPLLSCEPSDAWPVYTNGKSGIFSINQNSTPVGYHATFDSVSSIDYFVVDNMESYTTRTNLQTVWKDGYTGTTTANSGSNITVSTQIDPRTTGPDIPPDNPPGPIHEGSQAMQFAYDNDGTVTLYVPGYTAFTYSAPLYSEIEASTPGLGISSNWTMEGIKALSLYIYGNADNIDETLYLVLEDSDSYSLVKCEKVIYSGTLLDLNLRMEEWQEWIIDLEEFTDVDLTDVQKIYIGFGDRDNPQSGGSGVVYFDDILLYKPRCIPALGPAGDIAQPFDCKVNFLDLAVMAGGWLDEGLFP
jgi:hypothetical protein